jgi:LysR family transcriptional activator of nhaA
MSPTVLEDETLLQYGVSLIGRTDELVDEYFAISVERRIRHPCVVAITEAAHTQLFGS